MSTKKDLPITYTDYFNCTFFSPQSHSRLRWSLILWCVTVGTSRGKPSGCLDITLPKISWPQFCTWQAISMTKLLNTRQTEQGYMEATNKLQWRTELHFMPKLTCSISASVGLILLRPRLNLNEWVVYFILSYCSVQKKRSGDQSIKNC